VSAQGFDLWLSAYFAADDETGASGRARSRRRDDAPHSNVQPESALSPDDRDLIDAVRQGDTRRFAVWYDLWYEPAWRFARRFVDDDAAAHDVVQDVFLAIWGRRAAWTVQGTLQAYLFGAVRHRALNARRHDRVVDHALGRGDADTAHVEAPGMSRPLDAPDTLLAESELADAMRRAVESLPERQRTAMVLRWDSGLANVEIAAVLGVGEAAVSRLIARATDTLRETWTRLNT